jgi:hypothetical protein
MPCKATTVDSDAAAAAAAVEAPRLVSRKKQSTTVKLNTGGSCFAQEPGLPTGQELTVDQ